MRCGVDDDSGLRKNLPHLLQKRRAVRPRHVDFGDDDVYTSGVKEQHRILNRVRRKHLAFVLNEEVRQPKGPGNILVNNQYLRSWHVQRHLDM